MKSKIMLNVDGGGSPMITVVRDSEDSYPNDVRDTLVSLFFEKFGHSSNYLVAEFSEVGDKKVVNIRPIPPSKIKDTQEGVVIIRDYWLPKPE